MKKKTPPPAAVPSPPAPSPFATQNLAIDLDDGVKVNYLKFGEALKTIPGLAAKEEE